MGNRAEGRLSRRLHSRVRKDVRVGEEIEVHAQMVVPRTVPTWES